MTPTYDNGNRVTQVVDSLNGTFTYSHDLMDRVLTESGPKGTVTYTYDIAGRRSTMQVAGQAVVSYSYDGASRLTQIQQGSLVVGFGYDAAGRPVTLTLPNSVVASYSYDAASRLTGITWARLGVAIGNLTYEYDPAGRKTAVGGSLARTGLPAAVGSATHNAANRVTSWNGSTLTYDDNGNLTSDGSRTYSWNARDQMTGISGAVSATFQYDPAGRRMQKTVAGSTTGYLYDGANIVQEQGVGASNLVTGFGHDQFYARTDGSGTQVPLSDSLQSTVGMTDAGGGLGAQFTYEPYGGTTVAGSGGGSQQFTGRENDGTGLMYYRARYYAPGMGRFVSEDPLGFGGGDVNLYGYVGGGPTGRRDPTGMFWVGVGTEAAASAVWGTMASMTTNLAWQGVACWRGAASEDPLNARRQQATLVGATVNGAFSALMAIYTASQIAPMQLKWFSLMAWSGIVGMIGNMLESLAATTWDRGLTAELSPEEQQQLLSDLLLAANLGMLGGMTTGLLGSSSRVIRQGSEELAPFMSAWVGEFIDNFNERVIFP